MTVHRHELEARFKPMRPASRPRLVLASLLGPVAWVLAFLLVSVLINFTIEIELGLLVTVASLVVAALVLALLRHGRDSEERRYVGPA
ncbi:MAG: hypothetical protein JO286_14870 [Solirubrobacterales bacterium]|nr:hypothetical protein [Solirubrobacterales bacterium]MBV9681763.1 hypothetical protein [Solirubrobacterales bacterium]MBV9808467.1 hypothetical protein [Solirubrobacterales bacterium]